MDFSQKMVWNEERKSASRTMPKAELEKIRNKAKEVNIALTTDDGKQIGNVSQNAYNAIQRNALGLYTPVNDEEKKTLDSYTQHLKDKYGITIAGPSRKAKLKDLTVNSFQQGFLNNRLGEENYKKMYGNANSADKIKAELSSDKYNYEARGKLANAVSGAAQFLGQQLHQLSDEKTLGAVAGTTAATLIAGNAGPQALVPEEIITVPAAIGLSIAMGSAMVGFEVEAGNAYDEMLENGVSEEVARNVALGVGGVNAALEGVQVADLLKSFKILKADDLTQPFAKKLAKVLVDRGINVASETGQELAQETSTIIGVQAATKADTGKWAYSANEVADRLKETAVSSALSFGLMGVAGDVPGTVIPAASRQRKLSRIGKLNNAVDVINKGLSYDKSSEAYKNALKLQKQNGKRSDAAIGYQAVLNSAMDSVDFADKIKNSMKTAKTQSTEVQSVQNATSQQTTAATVADKATQSVDYNTVLEQKKDEAISDAAKFVSETIANVTKNTADYSMLYQATADFLNTPVPSIDRSTVKQYADIFASSIKADSIIAQTARENGVDISDMIVNYVVDGIAPEVDKASAAKFMMATRQFNDVFARAMVRNLSTYQEVRGNNDILAAQVNAISNGDYSFMRNTPGVANISNGGIILNSNNSAEVGYNGIDESRTSFENDERYSEIQIAKEGVGVQDKSPYSSYRTSDGRNDGNGNSDISERTGQIETRKLEDVSESKEFQKLCAFVGNEISWEKQLELETKYSDDIRLEAQDFTEVYVYDMLTDESNPLRELFADEIAEYFNNREVGYNGIDTRADISQDDIRFGETQAGNTAKAISETGNIQGDRDGGRVQTVPRSGGYVEKRAFETVIQDERFQKFIDRICDEVSHETWNGLYTIYEHDTRITGDGKDVMYDFSEVVVYDMLTDERNPLRELFADEITKYFSKDNISADTDITGAKVSRDILDATKDSVAKNDKGQLVPVYHSTDAEFDAFVPGDIGIHFGSYAQAKQRATDKGNANPKYIKAYLNITKPLYVDEDFIGWNAYQISEKLAEMGIMTINEANEYLQRGKTPENNKMLVDLLRSKGYDGIIYANDQEALNGKSYIVFDDSQVFRIDEAKSNKENVSTQSAKGGKALKDDNAASGSTFIDDRTTDEVGDRQVKAFQFEHPEVKPFYKEIAQELRGDLSDTQKGERYATDEYGREWTGTKRITSESIAKIKDGFGVTYSEIDRALERLIEDNGMENVALAKRIELVIDEMLTDGYNDFYGRAVPPSAEYIALKEKIGGRKYDTEKGDFDGELPVDSTNNGGNENVNKRYVSGRDNIPSGDRGWRDSEPASEPAEGFSGGAGQNQRIEGERGISSQGPTGRSDGRPGSETDIRGDGQRITGSPKRIVTEQGTVEYNEIPAESLENKDEIAAVIAENERKGLKTVFYKGWAVVDGKTKIRGFFYDDTVYIMCDHPEYSITQINDHEFVHKAAGTAAFEKLKGAIKSKLSAQELAAVRSSTLRNYGSTLRRYMGSVMRNNPDMSIREIDALGAEYLYEEIVANLNGNMGNMQDYADRFAEDVAEFRSAFDTDAKTEVDAEVQSEGKANDKPGQYKAETDAGGNVKFSIQNDNKGGKYWQIETKKDIFKGITDRKELQKSAYDYILHGIKGESIKEIIDGQPLLFTRIGAKEYVYGSASKKLDANNYAKKLRIAPSIIDLIENASDGYHTPDHKDHKFAKDGFENYRGRVKIDDVIFTYVVRVGQDNTKNVFYDINLEVESTLPGTDVRQGYKNDSTSTDRISQKDSAVNSNSMQKQKNNTGKSGEARFSVDENNGKSYNNSRKNSGEQYRVMWTLDDNVLTNNEVSAFYEKISEMRNNQYSNYRKSADGEYIFEIRNKLIYTDGKYNYPSINTVITFNTDNETELAYLRKDVYDAEKSGYGHRYATQIVAIVYGEKFVSTASYADYIANEWGERNGTRKDSKTTDSGSGKNVRFSTEETTDAYEIEGLADFMRMFDAYDNFLATYGFIKPGENPARDVQVPKKTADKKYVSKFARTMMEAGVTPDDAVDEFKSAIVEGRMSHMQVGDKAAKKYALDKINELGFDGAMERWNSIADMRGIVDKFEIVFGMELYNQCINAKDVENAMRIAVDLTHIATKAGQAVQSFRVLKTMSPDGQLYCLEKSVQTLNRELQDTLKDKANEIKIDEQLAKDYLTAKTAEEKEMALDNLLQDVADQIPATNLDKWNAWRYLSMLGNPRTHFRNIVGNAIFYPVRGLKNAIGAVLERRIPIEERTKSLTKDRDAVAFAKEYADKVKEEIKGNNGKYDIGYNGINEKRTIFNTRALEWLRKKNMEWLDTEDWWFLKPAYVSSLAQIMTARGITAEFLNSGTKEAATTLERLHEYAMLEAQKATFRDANALANALNEMRNRAMKKGGIGKVAWITVGDGVMPFRNAPLNIGKRAVEYSPASIIKACTVGARKLQTDENFTAADLIDDIAKGMTGSILVLFGMLFAHWGWINGGDDENKKKRKFDETTGWQGYSLNIGDYTYTIDWAAPSVLPLFVGVELMNSFKRDGITFKYVVENSAKMLNPMLELSCLQSLSSLVASAGYNQTGALSALFSDALTSYVSQAYPTVFGQVARTIDGTRRKTYIDKNSDMPVALDSFIQSMEAKVPFMSKRMQPRLDAWGREMSYGDNPLLRAVGNFVSPGYAREKDTTRVTRVLNNLYEKTNNSIVYPVVQGKTVTIDKVSHDLTASQYTWMAKKRGKLSLEMVNELIYSSSFSSATDEEKLKMLEKCYDNAYEQAKSEFAERYGLE